MFNWLSVETRAEIFKLLSVETRIKIIELLKTQGPLGAKEIGVTIGITTAAVSQHLKTLKQARLVRSERKGYWIPYSIDEEVMENYRQILNDVCTCGCQGKGKIRGVESEKSDLDSLIKYEKELYNELNTVQKKIKELTITNK